MAGIAALLVDITRYVNSYSQPLSASALQSANAPTLLSDREFASRFQHVVDGAGEYSAAAEPGESGIVARASPKSATTPRLSSSTSAALVDDEPESPFPQSAQPAPKAADSENKAEVASQPVANRQPGVLLVTHSGFPDSLPDFISSSSRIGCDYCQIVARAAATRSQLAEADALLFYSPRHKLSDFPARPPSAARKQLFVSISDHAPLANSDGSSLTGQPLGSAEYRRNFDVFANSSLASDVPGVAVPPSIESLRQPPPDKGFDTIAVWYCSDCNQVLAYRMLFVSVSMRASLSA